MNVTVMEIREVRVLVDERRMAVAVAVWLARGIVRAVGMLVMLVVAVEVLVLHFLMGVFVVMPLGEVEIDAGRHERRGKRQLDRDRVAEEDDRDQQKNQKT